MTISEIVTEQEKVSSQDLDDAKQTLKDWSYQYGVSWDHNIDTIWPMLVRKSKLQQIPLIALRAHHDWGRRPTPEQSTNPIIVGQYDQKYVILDGQHRVLLAKEQNQNEISALVIPLPLQWSKFRKRYQADSDLIDQMINEHIVKRGSEYCLLSKKSNRNLGCYRSRKGAEKREQQVQYFKQKIKETSH
jgi:hypothetical protein